MNELNKAKETLDKINGYNPKEINYTALFNCLVQIAEQQQKEIEILKERLSLVSGKVNNAFAKY